MAVLIISISYSQIALSADSPDEKEIGMLMQVAENVVIEMNGPYIKAAELVSPLRLPDSIDYILYNPLDTDIDFSLDIFKSNYCRAIPADAELVFISAEVESIYDWRNSMRKEGVPLPTGELVNSVKRVSLDVVKENGRWSFQAVASEKAVLNVPVDFHTVSGTSCNNGGIIEMEFVRHGDEWKLYDILLRSPCFEKSGLKTKMFSPYYEDCINP